MRVDHIALYCIDLEGMKSFFMEYFGCTPNELYHNSRTGLKTYILSFPDGGAKLEIMARPEVIKPMTDIFHGGFIHLSIALGSKEAVEEKTEELKSDDYECISGPRTTGDGYYESCIVGPEGILLEITV
jgi:lactoylglutathione lyase